MLEAGNFAPGNAGVPFFMDVICPVLSIVLLVPLHSDFDRLTVLRFQCGQVGPINQDSDTPRDPRAP